MEDKPFEGFEFTVRKKREYVAEGAEGEQTASVDKSLDELVNEKRKPKKEKGKGWSHDSSDDDDGDSPRRRIVNLHLPRELIEQIAERAGVSVKGHYVKVEAVVTRRK